MDRSRIIVFLPCHSLGDFPTWLDEGEADDLLTAWTAAWHPHLIAAVGRRPEWASADFTPLDLAGAIGIVPGSVEERFAAHVDASALDAARWVRGVCGRDAIAAAAAAASGQPPATAAEPLVADFHALGFAWLLADLLARRMRSEMDLASSGFDEAVVDAAQAAVAGNLEVARSRLAECFAALEASRSHYYPVDVWLLDTVLLAPSTLGPPLDEELDSPVPLGIVATGDVVETLAATNPAALATIRSRLEQGTLAAVGGRVAARPVDLCTPQEIEADLDRGRQAWERHLATHPQVFGQIAGGMTPILPKLLSDRGYAGCLWTLFDGTPLPDAGGSRILWEGRDGGTIAAIPRPPLDARRVQTFLTLAEQIGTCMDQDHTVVVQFAHYPGTACRWHDDFRRIASWSKVCGEFVTPDDLFRRTADTGLPVSFPADAYPVTLPNAAAGIREQVAAEVAHAAAAAAAIAAPRPPDQPPAAVAAAKAPDSSRQGWFATFGVGWLGGRSASFPCGCLAKVAIGCRNGSRCEPRGRLLPSASRGKMCTSGPNIREWSPTPSSEPATRSRAAAGSPMPPGPPSVRSCSGCRWPRGCRWRSSKSRCGWPRHRADHRSSRMRPAGLPGTKTKCPTSSAVSTSSRSSPSGGDLPPPT